MLVTRWCSGCVAEAQFERFDCPDHGDDCVELVCTDCGHGLELVAPQTTDARVPAVPSAA